MEQAIVAIISLVGRGIFSPEDGARLLCPIYVYGKREAQKMEASYHILKAVRPETEADAVRDLKEIWRQ